MTARSVYDVPSKLWLDVTATVLVTGKFAGMLELMLTPNVTTALAAGASDAAVHKPPVAQESILAVYVTEVTGPMGGSISCIITFVAGAAEVLVITTTYVMGVPATSVPGICDLLISILLSALYSSAAL